MFKGVQAEVDALIEMGFGEESLAEVFRKKGAKGIRSLWSKEVEESEKRKEPKKKFEGVKEFRFKSNYDDRPPPKFIGKDGKEHDVTYASKYDDRPPPKFIGKDGKEHDVIYKASGGSVKKNYAYGGRVAKMSSEKS